MDFYPWDLSMFDKQNSKATSPFCSQNPEANMASAEGKTLKIGMRVEVRDKGTPGTVAYVGTTLFSSGKWIGVVLDDPKGKNNGTVQGKKYFDSPDNHGIFIRQSQLNILEDSTPVTVPVTPSAPKSGLPHATPRSKLPQTPAEQSAKKSNRLSGIRPPSSKSIENLAGSDGSGRSTPTGDATPTATPKGLKTPGSSSQETIKPPVKSIAKAVAAEAPERKVSQVPNTQTSAAQISGMSKSIDSQMFGLQQQQEMDGLKAEVKDLEEKLETIKIKRAEDKTKLKEAEKMKIQLQQLQEYKTRMQETQQDLQRQLQASKKEAKDSQDAFERYKDEMSDLAETVEMAALDKEMAEEKAETLQVEVETLKERCEELNVDMEIMKNEMAEPSDGAANSYQVKQLEQQNERLKEALVKLRDLSNNEKHENQSLNKQLEQIKAENKTLAKDKEKLAAEVMELQNEAIDLKEQVDAALGAEEMVERLTEQNLAMEEQIQSLEEEKTDLEQLHEMNEELQENARHEELELREEVDLANSKFRESQRKLEAVGETIADYENTVSKFRDLVAQLQESNRELRSRAAETEHKGDTPTMEAFDFKTKFAETKAYAKAIDMELRKLDVDQCNKHVDLLKSFMPENFLRRGSDHDALLLYLLIPRLQCKAELLARQAREKFSPEETIERADVVKSSRSEQFSFANGFIHQLAVLGTILGEYKSALDSCSPDLFVKIGTLLPEIAVHEKSVDYYIDLLRNDRLDENVSLEALEKSIAYFQHLYNVHLAQETSDCTLLMADQSRVLLAACDCISMDITRLKLLLQGGQETSDICILLRELESQNNATKVAARKIKRRTPQPGSSGTNPLSFSKEVEESLTLASKNLENIVKSLQFIAKGGAKQAALLTEGEGVAPKKMEELAFHATDVVYGKDDDGPFNSLRASFKVAASAISSIAEAMENGEYDFDGTHAKKAVPPIVARGNAVRGELSDVEHVKFRLEAKDEDIKELKKLLKLKQEELSEQQVRVGLIERKLENSGKDSDDRVEKVQRKLDEANLMLKKKEKEFDETFDALQSDIDSLENEKSELKERLKMLSKKALIEGLTQKSAGISASPGGAVTPPSPGGSPVRTIVGDSPLLLQQISSLREALKFVKHENIRLKGEKMKVKLAGLPDLQVPKKPTGLKSNTGFIPLGELPVEIQGGQDLQKLSKQTNSLMNEVCRLSCTPMVVDITKRRQATVPAIEKASPASQLIQSASEVIRLQKQADELQVKITTMLAQTRNGGQVKADFSSFPSPAYSKVLEERTKDTQLVGRIRIPAEQGKGGDVIPVLLQPDQLRRIHSQFVS
ncbi:unnamed protein product [Owenia fusiformis]|uniref:Dynactin subunit 1 n=1 Tax=Owenia fusiformis TaxID=6347 RepID=A0A8S4NSY5_OWEFU|nr:unnamed protein product [Owenia fusiformis]